eukprot:scaffold172_cov254-Pinguiococcus_pyrenoidosus.AAC.23
MIVVWSVCFLGPACCGCSSRPYLFAVLGDVGNVKLLQGKLNVAVPQASQTEGRQKDAVLLGLVEIRRILLQKGLRLGGGPSDAALLWLQHHPLLQHAPYPRSMPALDCRMAAEDLAEGVHPVQTPRPRMGFHHHHVRRQEALQPALAIALRF